MTVTEATTETQTPARPWRITWRDKTWTEDDMTGQHLAVLALVAGRDDFDMLEISPSNGHQRLMMVISAFVAVDRTGAANPEDADEVAAVVAESVDEVSRASVVEILGALSYD